MLNGVSDEFTQFHRFAGRWACICNPDYQPFAFDERPKTERPFDQEPEWILTFTQLLYQRCLVMIISKRSVYNRQEQFLVERLCEIVKSTGINTFSDVLCAVFCSLHDDWGIFQFRLRSEEHTSE